MILLKGNIINISPRRFTVRARAMLGNVLLATGLEDGEGYHIEALNNSACYKITDSHEAQCYDWALSLAEGWLKEVKFDTRKEIAEAFQSRFNVHAWQNTRSYTLEEKVVKCGLFKKKTEMVRVYKPEHEELVKIHDSIHVGWRLEVDDQIDAWFKTKTKEEWNLKPLWDEFTKTSIYSSLEEIIHAQETQSPEEVIKSQPEWDKVVDDIFSQQVEAGDLEKRLLGLNKGKVKVKPSGISYSYEGPVLEELFLRKEAE